MNFITSYNEIKGMLADIEKMKSEHADKDSLSLKRKTVAEKAFYDLAPIYVFNDLQVKPEDFNVMSQIFNENYFCQENANSMVKALFKKNQDELDSFWDWMDDRKNDVLKLYKKYVFSFNEDKGDGKIFNSLLNSYYDQNTDFFVTYNNDGTPTSYTSYAFMRI